MSRRSGRSSSRHSLAPLARDLTICQKSTRGESKSTRGVSTRSIYVYNEYKSGVRVPPSSLGSRPHRPPTDHSASSSESATSDTSRQQGVFKYLVINAGKKFTRDPAGWRHNPPPPQGQVAGHIRRSKCLNPIYVSHIFIQFAMRLYSDTLLIYST